MKNLSTYDYFLSICIFYWGYALIRSFLSENHEMGDSFSVLVYSFFLCIHLVILGLKYLLRNTEKSLNILMIVSVPPAIISGLSMLVSIFGGIAILVGY